MKKIQRILQAHIEKRLFKGKAIIIYGARQVGKTTLVKDIQANTNKKSLYLNCELLSVKQNLEILDVARLKSYFGEHTLLILDEAQQIENIGKILKIIVDEIPEIQIIATGSSSFDLANKTAESMTGRKEIYKLYSLSLEEIANDSNRFMIDQNLENIMRFGTYPEVFRSFQEDENYGYQLLDEITSSYLYKDVLKLENLRKSSLFAKLLQLLALQIGSEVSLHELANNLGINRLTVEKYLDLLEQSFVIFRLRSFSRNLRNELSKSQKVYFYDLGIRNSLIQNFNSVELRNDIGAMWENLMISERIKTLDYNKIQHNKYFWRTYDQKEIDYIEEREGKIFTTEFKWNNRKKPKIPASFQKAYPESTFNIVDKENYWEFLSKFNYKETDFSTTSYTRIDKNGNKVKHDKLKIT